MALAVGAVDSWVVLGTGSRSFVRRVRTHEHVSCPLDSVKTFDEGIDRLDSLIHDSAPGEFRRRRMRMLDETIDVARFIADRCEEFARS